MSKIFNDPIWGRIDIPEYCLKIIDTPHFQRLRHLKQLGITSYVFHGAEHSRFSHSIGVCWLSGKWIKHLAEKQPELNITSEEIKIVQISGLVHDIGHGPFSHTFERFIKRVRPSIKYNHEDMSVKILKEIYQGPDLETICKIIKGNPIDRPFLAQIIHNTVNGIDADKLDYFTRDSQCTSFKIGCDPERIIYESRVIGDEICFPIKLVGDIWNIYQTRFRLYRDLYFHKTSLIIEDMLLEAMILSNQHNIFEYVDSNYNYRSLADSIDNVTSFIKTNDDIFGQMHRTIYEDISMIIDMILKREFIIGDESEIRTAHYGLKNENPLTKVKFFDKDLEIITLNSEIINSMCPTIFSVDIIN